jgi:hypothetical protein
MATEIDLHLGRRLRRRLLDLAKSLHTDGEAA